jgi:ribonuclease inhibitor
MEFVLEGDKIRTEEDFHREVKIILQLPEHYGSNLDALWDCLTGWIDTPLTLVWKDFEISKRNTGEFAEKVKSVFKSAEKQVDGFVVIIR